jgi:hypothetical protein
MLRMSMRQLAVHEQQEHGTNDCHEESGYVTGAVETQETAKKPSDEGAGNS